ncbi:IS66 family transposase, partial [Methylibium sp.]|uniref:IS66 family transposase n=1 Tax=Methylibium sp. TaxID=2067992 RepID=UPI00286BE42A
MLNVHELKAQDLRGLSPSSLAEVAAQMLQRIGEQSKQIAERDRAIKFKDAKLERITFELARLKAWKFAAKTERMNAEQRQLFEETLAADEASLEAQLEALQAQAGAPLDAVPVEARRRPKRQALPEHLVRVEHHHEPEDTTCPSPDCGQPMVRVGQDVSERLDIVPAQFFVHRHIRGKWACRCCELLVQEPVAPQIIDSGMPAAGLVAHTLVSRFIDHLPYYRQEQINARSGVHTPRSTLAAWSGRGGAALQPLFDAHREFVLGAQVLHADETPVNMLDPGAGKTKKAYVWAYARSGFDALPGVVYDFCVGRGAKYPMAFLQGWSGTLVRDEFKGYESVLKLDGRKAAGCLAHARRKFDELIKVNQSPVATQAVQRIAWLYRIEREARDLAEEERLAMRQARAKPLWEELHVWLRLERTRVPEGSAIAGAIDYSLNAWAALTANLHDGMVPIDNNHIENLMRPWAMGRNKANFAFMRSRPNWLSGPALKARHGTSRRGCGLRIKTSISCSGN